MDIVELVENVCGAKINKYQKPFLYDLSRKYDVKVVSISK